MQNPFPEHIINGSLCYILHDNKVLLLRRSRPPHQGFWSAPGGKMEHGESPQETVIREITEETGLTVKNPQLRALQTSVDIAYPVHWMLYVFVATEFSGQLVHPDTAEGVLQWHPLDTLSSLNLPYPDTLYWQYITGEKSGVWQGKVVYNTPEQLISEEIYAPL